MNKLKFNIMKLQINCTFIMSYEKDNIVHINALTNIANKSK